MPSLSPGREGAKVLERGSGGLELSFAAACFLLFGLVFVVVVFFALGGFPFFFGRAGIYFLLSPAAGGFSPQVSPRSLSAVLQRQTDFAALKHSDTRVASVRGVSPFFLLLVEF